MCRLPRLTTNLLFYINLTNHLISMCLTLYMESIFASLLKFSSPYFIVFQACQFLSHCHHFHYPSLLCSSIQVLKINSSTNLYYHRLITLPIKLSSQLLNCFSDFPFTTFLILILVLPMYYYYLFILKSRGRLCVSFDCKSNAWISYQKITTIIIITITTTLHILSVNNKYTSTSTTTPTLQNSDINLAEYRMKLKYKTYFHNHTYRLTIRQQYKHNTTKIQNIIHKYILLIQIKLQITLLKLINETANFSIKCTPCLNKKMCLLFFCSMSVKYEWISIKTGTVSQNKHLIKLCIKCPLVLIIYTFKDVLLWLLFQDGDAVLYSTVRGDHRSRGQYDNLWSVLRSGQISPLHKPLNVCKVYNNNNNNNNNNTLTSKAS